MDDIDLVRHLAMGAGEILLSLRNEGKLSGKALGKAGDERANTWLMETLAEHRKHDGILSEETADTPARLEKSRVWIIDPLDGTREYSEGRNDWAVHIGLAVEGAAVLGAVALPGAGKLFDTENEPPKSSPEHPPRMVVSRTRPAAEAVEVAKHLGARLMPMGSAGAKTMAVVSGEADIYLHSGGQYEWDNCAPVAVALAAGLHCSRLNGDALAYNRFDPYSDELLVCDPDMANEILGLITGIRGA